MTRWLYLKQYLFLIGTMASGSKLSNCLLTRINLSNKRQLLLSLRVSKQPKSRIFGIRYKTFDEAFNTPDNLLRSFFVFTIFHIIKNCLLAFPTIYSVPLPVQEDAGAAIIPQQAGKLINREEVFKTSELLKRKDHVNMLATELGANFKLELLYKGTKDGMKPQVFHERIDNKGPTLHLFKSENGWIFGGYTSIPYSSNDRSSRDPKAFIFSLTKLSVHRQKADTDSAVFHHKQWFSTFGYENNGGSDIFVASSCTCFTNLGNTYKIPDGMDQKSSDQIHKHLGGTKDFKIKEIEVFRVVFL